MKLRHRVVVSIIIGMIIMVTMHLPADAQIVADDSYAGIPSRDLTRLMKIVTMKFISSDTILFAGLKVARHGYCGFVNATLEHNGFIPFFFDADDERVQFGIKGTITDAALSQLEQCQ